MRHDKYDEVTSSDVRGLSAQFLEAVREFATMGKTVRMTVSTNRRSAGHGRGDEAMPG